MKPICSVLIPTRGRVAKLKRCIESLHASAKSSRKIEVLLYVDDDDQETLRAMPSIVRCKCSVTTGPRFGWKQNSKVFDILASKARGDWIWLLNDDAVISGEGWEAKLSKMPTKGVIVGAEVTRMHGSQMIRSPAQAFPIITRKCYGKNLPEPADSGLHELLTGRGWRWDYLPGITAWHDIGHDHTTDDKNWRAQ